MSAELQLPAGIGMQRHGHVLTLSGFWDEELLDELQHGLMDLRQALPRAAGRKLVTLHLFNFAISASAVSGALSLVRRAFVDLHTDVAVVAEGSLTEAGLLFLAGSQQGHRKAFPNVRVEFRLSRQMGLVGHSPAAQNQSFEAGLRSLYLALPDDLKATLTQGATWVPVPTQLQALNMVDKILAKN